MGLNIFEEVRFILELMLAIYPLGFIVFKRKKNFLINFILGIILIIGIAISFVFIQDQIVKTNQIVLINFIHIFWYLLLTILVFIHVLICFKCKFNVALLAIVGGYAIQHISYIIVNEYIYFEVLKDFLTSNLFIYALLCLGVTILIYFPYYLLIYKFRKEYRSLFDGTYRVSLLLGFIFITLESAAFMSQYIYRTSEIYSIRIVLLFIDLMMCVIVIILEFLILIAVSSKKNKELYYFLYAKEKEQYKLFKDNNELINIKYHDLKHELKKMNEKGIIDESSYTRIKNSIKSQDAFINTKNSDIDIILTDFNLRSLKSNIVFYTLVDGTLFKNIPIEEVYSLISNILENAFSYVSTLEGENKYIRFIVKKVNGFIVIKESNYIKEDLNINKDGTIETTKNNKSFHGFGMKSILLFVNNHNGNMKVTASDHQFEITILLPQS